MVAARAMKKYLFIIFVLYAIINVNALAQKQNSPLLNRMLDKIQQLQNELTELRSQNEINQHELKKLRGNLELKMAKLKTQISTEYTTPTTLLKAVQTDSADTRIKQLTGAFQKLNQKLNQTNSRVDKLARIIETLQLQTPETPPIATPKQPPTPPIATPKQPPTPPIATPKQPPTPPIATPKQPPAPPIATPKQPPAPPIATPQQPQAIPQPKEKERVPPMEPAKLPDKNEYAAYSRAMKALNSADYTRLRDNLIRFLQDYPKGDYADDATYWIAESYYDKDDLDLAESYFTQLIENYSDSEKREPSLLKIAYIRLKNKRWDAARKVLELLENEAEDEQIRKLAIEQLERLESKGN